MTNPFFNYEIPLQDGVTIRAPTLNTTFSAIATAFDNVVVGTWNPGEAYAWTGGQDFTNATISGISVNDIAEVQAGVPAENDVLSYVGGVWVMNQVTTYTWDEGADYTLTGIWDFTGAFVTGIKSDEAENYTWTGTHDFTGATLNGVTLDPSLDYDWTGAHTFTIVPQILGNDTLHKGNIDEAVTVINAKTDAYTCVLTDRNSLITLDNIAAKGIVIPDNASVGYPVGTTLSFAQIGVGQVTITPGTNVILLSEIGLKIRAQNGMATALKIAVNTWLVSGALSA